MGKDADMNDRTCIVTRKRGTADGMIRFVADPDGNVVADIRARLPGRGCWVTAERSCLRQAMKRNLFARALKARVTVLADLDATVDMLLVSALTGMISMARKAGQVVTGATKVDAAVRSGRAIAVFNATDAAAGGVRKIEQACRVATASGGGEISAFRLLSADELAIVMAGGNVIHLAVLAGQAGEGVVKRAKMLDRYRNGAENGHTAGRPAQETDTE